MKWVIRIAVIALLALGVMAFHSSRQHRESRVDKARKDKIFLVGNGTEIETLDPHIATGVPEHQVLSAIFEGLVAYDPDSDYKDRPGAAATWEQENFTHWTFHLQPKARWSDGVPVTAQDFVYAYQRILSPQMSADYSELLNVLTNAEAFNKGEITDFSQVGVKALDDYTLKMELTGPTPYFTSLLKHYAWNAVPRHVVEKHGGMIDRFSTWTKPEFIVSNGPYKIKEWRFTDILKVDRNPYYWDAGTVKINEIHYFPIVDEGTEERAFRDGQLHLTNTLPLDKMVYYREHHQDISVEETLLSVYFYRLNTTRPPLNNVKVRRALALAVDRASLIRNVLRAGQRPAIALTPTSEQGYKGPDMMHFDPTEARRLLAEAGFPEGKGFPRMEILINTMEAHRLIAQAIQSMWRENLHIEVGILNQDWQVYLDSQRKLNYDVCRAGWVGDFMDPMTFLGIFTAGNGNNQTGWGNPKYDDLLKQSGQTGDQTARFALLKEAETILMEDQPIIPVYWYVHNYLLHPAVKHWHGSLLENRAYKYLDLEP